MYGREHVRRSVRRRRRAHVAHGSRRRPARAARRAGRRAGRAACAAGRRAGRCARAAARFPRRAGLAAVRDERGAIARHDPRPREALMVRGAASAASAMATQRCGGAVDARVAAKSLPRCLEKMDGRGPVARARGGRHLRELPHAQGRAEAALRDHRRRRRALQARRRRRKTKPVAAPPRIVPGSRGADAAPTRIVRGRGAKPQSLARGEVG